MLLTLLLSAALTAGAAPDAIAAANAEPPASAAEAPFPFDAAQLAGTWVSSVDTKRACDEESTHFRMQLSDDRQHLAIFYDRSEKTPLGQANRFAASIVGATQYSLTIRYENETRRNRSGKLAEWELIMVAPGVYRWREAEREAGWVNRVVGIRCSL